MDEVTRMLYKRYKLCKLCNNHYGSDVIYDNGNCPVCIQNHSKRSSKKFGGKPNG